MTSVATRAKNLNDVNGGSRGPRHPCDFTGSAGERMDFVMGNLIGHAVSVQLKDGTIWEGILSAGWWQEGVKGVALKQAKRVVKRDDKAQKPVEQHIIMRDEVVRLSTKTEVDLYNDELTEAARRRGGGIEVDSEIEVSGGRAAFGAERDLVMASAWVGDGDGSLEGLSSGGAGGVQRGWDQFAVNKQLGVTSSYSEELYTTKISDKKFSAEQLRRAERLAKEIESGTTSNAHIAEERGQKELEEHDGDMDEEEKYSMVLAPGRSAHSATPDVSDATPDQGAAKAAAGPATAPAAERAAPAAEEGAPSAATAGTPAARFGGSSKLRAAAKEFVPSFGGSPAVAPPPGGGVMPTGTPTGPPPQMVHGGAAYMGSPQGMSPGVAMGMQPGAMQQMGYPGGAMMHGGYMQSPGVHPGMHPQYQQQMAMQAQQQQQQQQQQYAAQQAAQQQQHQHQQYAAAQAAQQQRGQQMMGVPPNQMMMMAQAQGMMQPGMMPMQQQQRGMPQGRGPQGYNMQQMQRGAYPGGPHAQKAPQQPPPPPAPPQ